MRANRASKDCERRRDLVGSGKSLRAGHVLSKSNSVRDAQHTDWTLADEHFYRHLVSLAPGFAVYSVVDVTHLGS